MTIKDDQKDEKRKTQTKNALKNLKKWQKLKKRQNLTSLLKKNRKKGGGKKNSI